MGLVFAFAAEDAEACGGFFCGQTPVVQTGEQIVFVVDQAANTVDATIQISYQGNADDFAWVLPLQSAPRDVKVGSNRAFQVASQITAPQFRPTFEERGCPQRQFPGVSDAAASFGGVDAGSAGGPGVQVLARAQVGPYDSVVISGETPSEVREWLLENEYRVTEQMMDAVVPYLSKGDVLLALKLRGDANVQELQPIRVITDGTEVCVPLRLTAIAAQDDMDVTVYVLSNEGRAVPSNYLHVQPNFARLNWRSGGSDYRQLMGEAADEAGGNAFTTEFANDTSMFRQRIYSARQLDLTQVRASTNLGMFIDNLAFAGLFQRAELSGILRRHIEDSELVKAGLDPAQFWGCPTCFSWQLRDTAYDPTAAILEIEQRIITPDREAQGMFDQYRYLTRLFTLISPEEMGTDPIFSFDNTLPDVSNVHRATILRECDGSEETNTLILPNGQAFNLDTRGGLPADMARAVPAALKIEQLEEGRVIVDNTKVMDSMSVLPPATSRSCGCDSSASDSSGAAAFAAALFALAFVRRRR